MTNDPTNDPNNIFEEDKATLVALAERMAEKLDISKDEALVAFIGTISRRLEEEATICYVFGEDLWLEVYNFQTKLLKEAVHIIEVASNKKGPIQ